MVFSKPEGVGCSVLSIARALLRTRGFTKYHRSLDAVTSLFRVWPVCGHVYLYQYIYLVQKSDNTVFSCMDVYRGYTFSCKKLVGSLLKNEGD